MIILLLATSDTLPGAVVLIQKSLFDTTHLFRQLRSQKRAALLGSKRLSNSTLAVRYDAIFVSVFFFCSTGNKTEPRLEMKLSNFEILNESGFGLDAVRAAFDSIHLYTYLLSYCQG